MGINKDPALKNRDFMKFYLPIIIDKMAREKEILPAI